MLKYKQGGRPMFFNIPNDFSTLDKQRTSRMNLYKRLFNMMMTDREFETISIKSWANIPRSRHLIKEYNTYKKSFKKNKKLDANC